MEGADASDLQQGITLHSSKFTQAYGFTKILATADQERIGLLYQ